MRPQSSERPQSAPRPLSPSHPHAPRHTTVKHAYLSPLGPPLLGAQARLPLPPPTPTPPGTSGIFSAHPTIFCLLLSTPSALRPFGNPPPSPQGKSAFIQPNHQSSRVHILICCCKYFHWGTSAPEQVDAVKNIQKNNTSGRSPTSTAPPRPPPPPPPKDIYATLPSTLAPMDAEQYYQSIQRDLPEDHATLQGWKQEKSNNDEWSTEEDLLWEDTWKCTTDAFQEAAAET